MPANVFTKLAAGAATAAASVGLGVPVKWILAANLSVTLAVFALLLDHRERISTVETKIEMTQQQDDITQE